MPLSIYCLACLLSLLSAPSWKAPCSSTNPVPSPAMHPGHRSPGYDPDQEEELSSSSQMRYFSSPSTSGNGDFRRSPATEPHTSLEEPRYVLRAERETPAQRSVLFSSGWERSPLHPSLWGQAAGSQHSPLRLMLRVLAAPTPPRIPPGVARSPSPLRLSGTPWKGSPPLEEMVQWSARGGGGRHDNDN